MSWALRAPLVEVEWVDICDHNTDPGLALQYTEGRLLAVDFESEGIDCVVLAHSRDVDREWCGFSTFPASVVLNLADLYEALGIPYEGDSR